MKEYILSSTPSGPSSYAKRRDGRKQEKKYEGMKEV